MFGKANFKFKNGDEVACKITGYKGVVIGRTHWLHNCNTYMVKSSELKDGKPMDAESFEEPRIELITKAKVTGTKQGEKTGGIYEDVTHKGV